MNTRNAYNVRASVPGGNSGGARRAPPVAMAMQPVVRARSQANAVAAPQQMEPAAVQSHPACSTLPDKVCHHALTDGHANARLAHCEEAVKGRFGAIEPALKKIAALPHSESFVEQAQAIARQALGYELPESVLGNSWISGPDMKALYASCAFSALKAAVQKFSDDLKKQLETIEDARNFFMECGFHAIDLSACADGRLKGISRYILRLPMSSFTRRKSYAGTLFDVETDVEHWQATELRRFREGVPSLPESGTRYLKIAVYHTSTSDTCHQGCAAHGSNERKAMEAALERLEQFRSAIEKSFCCGASTDILLIGVDTDTDSIRIHVPDSKGDISVHRYVDNAELYKNTLNMSAEQAQQAVYAAIAQCSQTEGWGAGEGMPHEGMGRFVATLLMNNLSQIEYVADLYGGRYPDIGHAEQYISVGDGFEEIQVRNAAYYAHLHSLEEGVADMDVGIKIFTGLNVKRGLPIPVAIHYRYNANVPGSRDRMIEKARRVRDAIKARYADLDSKDLLFCHLSVQDKPAGSPLETVEDGL